MPSFSAITHLDKRYLIVLGACLTQFTVIGLLFSYGLFFKIFEVEFGWSRTLLSSCMSVAFIVMGVLAFFGGRLSDRYGPRLVLAVAGTLCGMGYALLSQVTQPWQLFAIFGLFIGVGMATHDVVTLSTIAREFRRRRGIMTGVVKVGTAAGQMTVPPIAAFLIAIYDWRLALIDFGYRRRRVVASCSLADEELTGERRIGKGNRHSRFPPSGGAPHPHFLDDLRHPVFVFFHRDDDPVAHCGSRHGSRHDPRLGRDTPVGHGRGQRGGALVGGSPRRSN